MKKTFLKIGVPGFSLLGILFFWFWPHHLANQDLFVEIKKGMTIVEVKALLGEPLQTSVYPMANLRPLCVASKGIEMCIYLESSSGWQPTLSGTRMIREDDDFLNTNLGDEIRFWCGKDKVLVVANDRQGCVTVTKIISVTKTGGGLLSWCGKQYDYWQK